MIDKISFGSSYRFAMTQPGVNKAKRAMLGPELEVLRSRVAAFQLPSSSKGYGRISVEEKFDTIIEGLLKRLQFKRYQKLPLHSVNISEVDNAMILALKTGDYQQKGMQKAATKNKKFADKNRK